MVCCYLSERERERDLESKRGRNGGRVRDGGGGKYNNHAHQLHTNIIVHGHVLELLYVSLPQSSS